MTKLVAIIACLEEIRIDILPSSAAISGFWMEIMHMAAKSYRVDIYLDNNLGRYFIGFVRSRFGPSSGCASP